MGRLTTHVLDTVRGTPASGLAIKLFALTPERRFLVAARTNADGRLEAPLLSGADLEPGAYELLFAAADYHRASGAPLAEPPFLDEVIIRFQIGDPKAHYHVPLLLSPWSYTTYRGS